MPDDIASLAAAIRDKHERWIYSYYDDPARSEAEFTAALEWLAQTPDAELIERHYAIAAEVKAAFDNGEIRVFDASIVPGVPIPIETDPEAN